MIDDREENIKIQIMQTLPSLKLYNYPIAGAGRLQQTYLQP